jgi:hypothetical protein
VVDEQPIPAAAAKYIFCATLASCNFGGEIKTWKYEIFGKMDRVFASQFARK